MKLNIFIAGCLGIALGLSSCTNQEIHEEDLTTSSIKSEYSKIQELVNLASSHYSQVFGCTRSENDLRLKGTEVLSRRQTRSNDNTSYIVINFEDGKGFSIVSDRRQIIAISNEGELHLSDTLDNTGLSWYLNEYLLGGATPVTPPVLPDTTYSLADVLVTDRCEPLLHGFKSQFNQTAPYNKYCFTSTGEQAVVGCVPLAVGTAMAYNKWPLTYGDVTFEWNEMRKSNEHDSWARLFEITGRPENTNASYGVNVTGASPTNILRTFHNMGYTGGYYTTFDKDVVLDELKSKNLVLIGGFGPRGGHRWILDGAYRMIDMNGDKDAPATYYYHCVWGWGGYGNGFYFLDEKSLGGTPYNLDDTYPTNEKYNLTTIVYGYRPNK